MNTPSNTVLEMRAAESFWPAESLPDVGRTSSTTPRGKPKRIDGILIGRLQAFDVKGNALVDFEQNPAGEPIVARHACALLPADAGRDAVLAFENGQPDRPIVLSLIRPAEPAQETEPPPEAASVSLDGEQITLSAKSEIVLRCGKSSITLTRAGKILIRGAYVLSRSSGANRIKGGSVQIN